MRIIATAVNIRHVKLDIWILGINEVHFLKMMYPYSQELTRLMIMLLL